MNRREFLNDSVWLGASAVMVSGLGAGLSAQTSNMAVRRPGRYDDSLIVERKPLVWPNGKSLAIWIIPNVETWDFHSQAGAAISPPAGNVTPDVINYAWREYGMRVGLWRIADILDSLGI